nr:LysR family transcriptional regulator [bacterium]
MTLRHLEIFIAVAEHGGMSAAANALYIAQPTVSQAIAELERQYGLKLFERFARKLHLTSAGQDLLGYARHILSSVNEMDRQMRYSAGRPTLKVGATITVATCLLPGILCRFESVHPYYRAEAWVGNTRNIEARVLSSQLDIGFVEGETHSPDIRSTPVTKDELILVCAPNHPLAGHALLEADALAGQDFVLREPGSGTRALFENYLSNHHIHVREKWVCNNSEAIKNAVMGGQGMTVISRLLVREELTHGKLIHIPLEEELMRHFSLIHHKNKYISPALSALMEACLYESC